MSYIIENILRLLKEKGITKKDFAIKLIDYNPKVGIKSEPPSERTIYLYLQGKRELKADLIPYIAEVLNVKEQELFDDLYIESSYNASSQDNCAAENCDINELISYLPHLPLSIIQSFLKISQELTKK